MAGLMRGAGLDFASNREHGPDRTEIVAEDGRYDCAAIFELKYAPEYESLGKKADEALRQMEEKKYAAGIPPNIRTVFQYGIAFWKKECCVKTSRVDK